MSRLTYVGFRDPVEMGAGSESFWSDSNHRQAGIEAESIDGGMWFRFTSERLRFVIDVPVTNITAVRRAKEAPPAEPKHQETKKK